MHEPVRFNASLLGREIALAECEAVEFRNIAKEARQLSSDQTRRTGAYVALGRAIVSHILKQRAYADFVAEARQSALGELERSGLSASEQLSRRRAIDKGISRARVSAEERTSGRTKAGVLISLPAISSDVDFTSTETEADRTGRQAAQNRIGLGKVDGDSPVERLKAIANRVRSASPNDPGFRVELDQLFREIDALPINRQ